VLLLCLLPVTCRFPVNLLFVSMIGSSFYALKAVGVGMVSE
jgi:hypothetical protein